MRRSILPLLVLAVLPLGGCAAGLAAGAVGAAVRAADGPGEPGRDLGPAAVETCIARASKLGKVHIIDVERRSSGNVIVWGTVEDERERRSFECRFDGKIAGFKLRPITRR